MILKLGMPIENAQSYSRSYLQLFTNIRSESNVTRKNRRKVILLHYYAFLLSVRLTFAIFLHAGKLTQQYIVDAYCKIEAERFTLFTTESTKITRRTIHRSSRLPSREV